MKIIALSRQIGSYGDQIARRTAEELNLKLAGPEEVHQLAQSCDPEFAEACGLYEQEIPKSFWERFFFDHPAYTSLFESLTFQLASQGDVVILGRGSQIVLLEVRGVMRTRIVAPFEIRAQRIEEQRNIEAGEARELVRKHGHRRRTLVESIYHHDLGDWSLYDLIVNTKDMTPEEGTFICVQAAKNMKPMPQERLDWLKRMAQAKLIESAIRKKVKAASFSNIVVESPEPGLVTIKGAVPDEYNREQAEDIAKSYPDVDRVDNRMKASTYFWGI
jgi:cytidylate kinase